MGKYVPLRFNDAEEEVLLRLYAASSDPALGTHIKRVYFDASQPNTNALQALRQDMEHIRQMLLRLNGAGEPGIDADLLMGLICGIYVMVRKSVEENVRAQADQFIDIAAVEIYLRGH